MSKKPITTLTDEMKAEFQDYWAANEGTRSLRDIDFSDEAIQRAIATAHQNEDPKGIKLCNYLLRMDEPTRALVAEACSQSPQPRRLTTEYRPDELREICIKLRVPDTGDDVLDRLISRSRDIDIIQSVETAEKVFHRQQELAAEIREHMENGVQIARPGA